MKYLLFLVSFFALSNGMSQLTDDFSDGDFTLNPTWSGSSADFIVNPSFELQLNAAIAGTSYLSTPHGLATLNAKEWRFRAQQSFSPSGSNNGRVYLTSSSADLSSDPDGFYIQMGEAGSNDAVRLFRVISGVDTEILAGPVGQIASSFDISIRVVRDVAANWALYIDPTGLQNYVLAGTVNDGANLLGTHFGMLDAYTASNSTNFYYDDIFVGDEVIDITPPVLVSATAINANLIEVLFDEAIDPITAQNFANYDIQPSLSASSATISGGNPALVNVVPISPLTNGSSYTMTTTLIEDLAGNVSGSQTVNFSYLIAEPVLPGDIAINEFMCDPTPVVGLPSVEFVELYNKSSKIFNVQNWQLGDNSTNGTMQNGWLLPGDYLVITATSNVDSFLVATAVTSFPGLNNAGDNIVIRDDNGVTLDSLSYTDAWYGDPNKDDGGYCLERINPNDPCTDFSDWRASNDPLGGTPGLVNSIFDPTPDTQAPGINQLIALAPNSLEIYFSEGMDSSSLAITAMTFSPNLTIQSRSITGANPSTMTIQFVENLTPSQVYSIDIQNIADCWLNFITASGSFALADNPSIGDVVINEIMFNPLTGGSDWVELYNKSDKLLNLINWELAGYSNDTISGNKIISDNVLLYPDSYVVIGEDSLQVLQNYPAYMPGNFVQTDIPSYSNDEGTVYLIFQNQEIDKVAYLDDWHFKLLDSDDGKTLERLDPDGISNDRNNWHTAAEAIGFATPGGENSQFYPATINGNFSFASESVSPDNDGFEDVLQVNYEMSEPGLVASFTIYDDRGRLIANVLKSELISKRGTFTWDGIRDDNTKTSIGMYIGVFEAFGIDGEVVFTARKVFTVAGKL
tara:strand:- start:3230 stop:5800 length:2571 start_codon:yes stop_codon:yes gene_type:complete